MDLDRALQLKSSEVEGYRGRACVCESQGRFDRAAEDFGQALRFVPDDALSQFNDALSSFDTKDFERALAQFGAAARPTPRDPAVRAWRRSPKPMLPPRVSCVPASVQETKSSRC